MRIFGIIAVLLLIVAQAHPVHADTFTSDTCGQGALNIPDATYDGSGNIVPGVLTCSLLVTGFGTIDVGNAVTVSLLGLAQEESGDLIASVTHCNADGTACGSPGYLFYRIGATSDVLTDPGYFGFYYPQFGFSSGTGDNYSFNSGFTGDLWGTAAALGSADYIPGVLAGGGSYWTTGPFSAAATPFSSYFAGQPVAGDWVLEIEDVFPGPSDPSVEGSLGEWQLTVETTAVPEPGYGGMIATALAAIAARRRFRRDEASGLQVHTRPLTT
jgi:hypothetical protein